MHGLVFSVAVWQWSIPVVEVSKIQRMVVGTFRKCMKKAKWKHNETGLQVAHLDVVPDL